MFEHAADLTGLQLKVNEAERNLSEAEANAERINDLLIDVEPRLRTLERAAKQAREWQGVHERLRFLEQGYFRHLLSERVAELVRAESVAEGGRKAAEEAREHVDRLAGELKRYVWMRNRQRAHSQSTRPICRRSWIRSGGWGTSVI